MDEVELSMACARIESDLDCTESRSDLAARPRRGVGEGDRRHERSSRATVAGTPQTSECSLDESTSDSVSVSVSHVRGSSPASQINRSGLFASAAS